MVEVQGLVKSFPGPEGELVVLDGLDLSVAEGRFLAVVGPSGCGKTTLLRIIAGLESPTRGQVLVDGRPVRGASPQVGLVFQQYALLPWRTTLGNVELGLELRGLPKPQRRRQARQYLQAFGLAGFEDRYPHQLSGGMQQRVAIARTLILEPRLVLMDEPFGSLDSQTRNQMQEFLLTVWQRRRDTIVFVTHNVDEAVFLADEIAVLSPRPARVLQRFSVDTPRPRDRTSPEHNAVRRAVLELLRQHQTQRAHPANGGGKGTCESRPRPPAPGIG